MILQTVLQTVLNQQFQTQQYGNVRITKPYEYNVEVPTNFTMTTCCNVPPQRSETYYCYMPPYSTTCNVYRSYC